MRYLIAATIVLLGTFVCSARAATLLVPSQYPTIQEGIDASTDGDTVIVAPGLYYERINFNGKNIVLTSTDPNDSRVVGYTIINGGGEEGSVVTFENYEGPNTTLTGFTITGGTGTLVYEWDTEKQYQGAGIYCNGSPTITHNVITNNVGPFKMEEVRVDIGGGYYYTYEYELTYGGGIYYGGSGTISYNVIYNNSGYLGGGIHCGGRATITNNLIYNNSAYLGGGVGMYRGYLGNNTLVDNDTSLNAEDGWGGNIYASFDYDYTTLTICNNIICNAGSGGGIFSNDAGGDAIRFNNVWNNQPANYVEQDQRTYEMIYGAAADWTGVNGNISADPIFSSSWSQRYRVDAESPCISAGDPNFLPTPGETDIDGDPRIYAVRVDIGADEHVGYVKPLAQAGDDQHILNPEPLTLDGTGSYFSEPDGVKTFQWTQTEGVAVDLDDSTLARPTFMPPAEGWYRFALVVGDHLYSSSADQVLVVVGNEAPVAHAGTDAIWSSPGGAYLDGSQSSDADPPDELTYAWTQIDGPPVTLLEPNSADPYFLCEETGIYTFELVVNDGFVSSEPDQVKIQASPFTVEAEPFEAAVPDDESFYSATISGTRMAALRYGYDGDWDILYVDAKTKESRLFNGGTTEARPHIDGDTIVWAGGTGRYYQPNRTNIYLADVATEEVVTLIRAESGTSCGYPTIDGHTVVWLRHRNVDTSDYDSYDSRPYDICGADISDMASPIYFTIAEDVGHGVPYPYDNYYRSNEDYVAISGSIVVWEGDGDIYGADISDLEDIKIFPICTAPERQSDPAISGNFVVWMDERDDIGDIYAADISEPNNVREFAVWVQPGWQLRPDIDGTIIACVEGYDYGGYIQTCCISRDYGLVEFSLAGWVYGGAPSVDGGTIGWARGELGGYTFAFGYGLTEGPVQNTTTGWHYDYIQHAISAAADGDVIQVEPGTYPEKLRLGGKGITVTSADPLDPAVRAATVITGGGQLVGFDDEETADCLFTGFTLTGGGFGIACNVSEPTITYCDIIGNRDAGIKLWGGSEPTVAHCRITDNGFGVTSWAETSSRRILRSAGTFQNCLIAGNRRSGFFGGTPTLSNCTIADNLGLGLDCRSAIIENSIVYFNNSGLENIATFNAPTITYSDIQGGWSGTGNIDVDPLFVARGSWTQIGQWLAGDYHVQSQGWSWDALGGAWTWDEATSPCIDAGDPSLPLEEEPLCEVGSVLGERASNTALNMGAYGGTAEASLAPRD